MRRATTAPLAAFAACALAVPGPSGAQWTGYVDAAVSRLDQAGLRASAAQSFAATIDGLTQHTWLRASTLGSAQPNGGWTGQALALGGFTFRLSDVVRWDAGAAVSAFDQARMTASKSGEVNARLQIGSLEHGVGVGGALGAIALAGSTSGYGRGGLEGWWSFRDEHLYASVAPVSSDVASYTDFGAAWRHDASGVSAGVNAGVRSRAGGGGWQGADVELWLAPRVALVLSAGSVLPDVTRGTPSTRYASAGVRISVQPHLTLWPARGARGGIRVMVTRPPSEAAVRIEVFSATATRVELMADFTGWEPVMLERADGRWILERPAAPGLHRIAVRLDGGPWVAPSNVPAARDELGGTVGLITVP